ncbi:hypothetical protein QVD17_10402 [Tagetes erecta]|uniref:Uncharacterized protein n=1 Tax=Tagetes erecta TaxID=13708 RepID=A0AAD8L2D6_TARER|nr:hypothetical protein QVD17_10402 [Tagetes erecta]
MNVGCLRFVDRQGDWIMAVIGDRVEVEIVGGATAERLGEGRHGRWEARKAPGCHRGEVRCHMELSVGEGWVS